MIHSFFSKLYHLLKIWTYNKPTIYFLYIKIFKKDRGLGFSKKTQMVIEGYPRSANTYSMVLVNNYLKKDVHVAHHLHNPSQLLRAVKSKVPAYLVIRNPKDAVASYVIRNKIPVKYALLDYISFHKSILPFIDEITVFGFDYIIDSPNEYLEKVVSSNIDLFVPAELKKIDNESVFNQIEDISKKNFKSVSETEVARPSESRLKEKNKLAEVIESPKYNSLLVEAENLYQTIISLQNKS